jgi:hypothetical protein
VSFHTRSQKLREQPVGQACRFGVGFIFVNQQPVMDTAAAVESYSEEFEDSAPQWSE